MLYAAVVFCEIREMLQDDHLREWLDSRVNSFSLATVLIYLFV